MPVRSDAVSIVVPVYESGRMLGELHSRLSRVLGARGAEHQIIFVDDCSPDDTWVALSELSRRDPNVLAIRLRRNAGYDSAVLTGLRYVTGDTVVVMDDDLQHAPEDIPALIQELAKGHDLVYANFPVKRQSPLKNFGSWLNGMLARWVLDKPSEIYLSPFKAFRRAIADEAARYTGPYPYVDGLLFHATAAIHQIEVEHHERATGQGQHGLRRSISIMLNFLTTFSLLPLRLVTVGGLAIAGLASSLALALVVANLVFGFGLDAPGWTSILLAVLTLGGLQLMAIGIVGEYVGRSYASLGGQRRAIVAEVLRAGEPDADAWRNEAT